MDDIIYREKAHAKEALLAVRRQKEDLRRRLAQEGVASAFEQAPEVWGKAAENVRRLSPYQKARTVLVSPCRALMQVRLNVLADRKRLVVPTPGMQKGFLLFTPEAVPFARRHDIGRLLPPPPFAVKLPYGKPLSPPVDCLVTDLLAVGRDGATLGEGQGHLDLQTAILQTLGWLAPDVAIVAVVLDDQILPSLPQEPADVRAHWIVTPQNRIQAPCNGLPRLEIIWPILDARQIRRHDALFFLLGARPLPREKRPVEIP